jgi:dienelactone hydrolase
LGNLTATSENYAEDVLAAIRYLKSRNEINPKQIGLIGHSEGGMIAPMVAAQSNDLAFIVLLAGMGQRGEDAIYTQTEPRALFVMQPF